MSQYYKKKKIKYAGGLCPRCGKSLVIRTNHNTNEQFIGCYDYLGCGYVVHEQKTRENYVAENSFPNGWKPNCNLGVYRLLEKCDSRPEIRYILGAAYYLDIKSGYLKDGISLTTTTIIHNGKKYEAIQFIEPFAYWGDSFAPSAMAFVPQLEFSDSFHHDFGIFYADDHAVTETSWNLELAVEIDYHPAHEYQSGKDKYRDSLVKYPVLRFKPETDSHLNWFVKVKNLYSEKWDT